MYIRVGNSIDNWSLELVTQAIKKVSISVSRYKGDNFLYSHILKNSLSTLVLVKIILKNSYVYAIENAECKRCFRKNAIGIFEKTGAKTYLYVESCDCNYEEIVQHNLSLSKLKKEYIRGQKFIKLKKCILFDDLGNPYISTKKSGLYIPLIEELNNIELEPMK